MSEESRETSMEEGQLVMPFYIICDVSGSMAGDLANLQDGLDSLWTTVQNDPVIRDLTRIGVLTFSTGCQYVTELGTFDRGAPRLSIGGSTNYGEAFRGLRAAIEADRAKLRAQRLRIYRPCAFFLTDGGPTDRDWEREFIQQFDYNPDTGQGFQAYPRFIPFGFRDAQMEILSKLAYPKKDGRAFVASAGTTVAQALDAIREFIGVTIISSGTSASNNLPRHELPTSAVGFNSAPSQYPGGDEI